MAVTLFKMLARLGLDAKDFHKGLDLAVKGSGTGAADITKRLGGIGIAAGAATVAVAAAAAGMAAAFTKLTVDAAPLQGIQAAFEGITGGADGTLDALRRGSLGMISNRNLMMSYNSAAQLVSKTFADTIPEAMGYMTKISASTGDSLDYLLDSYVKGIGRLSGPILDNLKIQVDVNAANEVYAKSIGKTVDALTKQEQQTALTNQVLKMLAANTARIPEVTGTATHGLGMLSTWFKNLKDDVGLALLPVLQELLGFLNMLTPIITDTVLPAVRALGGWVADIAREWTRGFADLIVRAATWGANIVESLAGGITGSGAIVRALRNVANTITTWLAPGSPPKLLPDLPEWGAGAIEAWLEGWSPRVLVGSRFLQDLRASLGGFLEDIDLGKGVDPARLEKAFGLRAPDVEQYLSAYRGVGEALSELANAREVLAKAEEEGDEEAIEAARERLKLAEKDEIAARRTFNAEERRIASRISAEARLADAIMATARVEAKAADDAARLAEEAEQRAIEQAYLQYRLVVAGTAAAQIPIWEEELAKVAEGTAEYWRIMTRLVELRRSAAEKTGLGFGESLADGVTEGSKKTGEQVEAVVEKIDWGGIGKAIGGALIDAILKPVFELPGRLRTWATSGAGATALFEAGGFLADMIIAGIRGLFGGEAGIAGTTASLESHLQRAAFDAGGAAIAVGGKLAEGVIASFAGALVGAPKEETMAAWAATVEDWRAPFAGIFTKIFRDPIDAAIVAQALLAVAADETQAAGVREAARIQAQWYINEYGLKIHGELGVMTADAFQQFAVDQGIIGAIERAGDLAGGTYSKAFIDAANEGLRSYQPELKVYGPEPPPGYYPPELEPRVYGPEPPPGYYPQPAPQSGPSVNFDRGAIELNVANGDPDVVASATEIGVRRALAAAGMIP